MSMQGKRPVDGIGGANTTKNKKHIKRIYHSRAESMIYDNGLSTSLNNNQKVGNVY
jgi:hypothetical protein